MYRFKKIGFILISALLVFIFFLVIGNGIFWKENIHLPGELSMEAITYSFFMSSLYLLVCITYFIENIKYQNLLLCIEFNLFIFFLFMLLGSIINLGFPDYNHSEISTFVVTTALIPTLVSIPITIGIYIKFKNIDLRPKLYIEILEQLPMFKSIKFKSPNTQKPSCISSSDFTKKDDDLGTGTENEINITSIITEDEVPGTSVEDEVPGTSVEDEVPGTSVEDEVPGISEEDEMIDSRNELISINYDEILKEVRYRLSCADNLEVDIQAEEKKDKILLNKSTVDIDTLLERYDIDKKTYLKAKMYFERSIFKKTLNPCNREDRETLEWEELKLLNKLGLMQQDLNFPYLITIEDSDVLIKRAFEFKTYIRDRDIFIPDINNLDNLKNGFEFEEYVVNFLKENNFTDINKLSNFEKNGADILAIKDKIRYAFKCKYYSNNVGVGAIKEVIEGSVYHYARVPVVVTNSKFSKNAITHANLYNVQLWDRLYLIENRKV